MRTLFAQAHSCRTGRRVTPDEPEGQVIDATAAFSCGRLGHEPTLRLKPNALITSWLCTCSRCGRLVEFKAPEGFRV